MGSKTQSHPLLNPRPNRVNRVFGRTHTFNELAWTSKLPELAHLLRREDIPRTPQSLPAAAYC